MNRPVDRAFADFLYCHFIENDPADQQWKNARAHATEVVDFSKIFLRTEQVDAHPAARAVLNSCQAIYQEMVKGNMDAFYGAFHNVKFDFIVGSPRSGGSYLLKEMYRGQGISLDDVHYYMHDMTPGIYRDPVVLEQSQELIDAEIVWDMVQMAAVGALIQERHGLKYVPKKTHGVPLYPELFVSLFPESRYIITYRDVDGVIASIRDKCGPPRAFIPKNRTEIERHIHLYLTRRGYDEAAIRKLGYFGAIKEFHRIFYRDCEKLPVRRTVDFGEGTNEFVKELYEINGLDYTAEKFHDRRGKGKAA